MRFTFLIYPGILSGSHVFYEQNRVRITGRESSSHGQALTPGGHKGYQVISSDDGETAETSPPSHRSSDRGQLRQGRNIPKMKDYIPENEGVYPQDPRSFTTESG